MCDFRERSGLSSRLECFRVVSPSSIVYSSSSEVSKFGSGLEVSLYYPVLSFPRLHRVFQHRKPSQASQTSQAIQAIQATNSTKQLTQATANQIRQETPSKYSSHPSPTIEHANQANQSNQAQQTGKACRRTKFTHNHVISMSPLFQCPLQRIALTRQ